CRRGTGGNRTGHDGWRRTHGRLGKLLALGGRSPPFRRAVVRGAEQKRRMSFIARHDLWNDDQRRAAEELGRRIEAERIELVRLSFPDLHGLLRGKALLAAAMP